MDARRRQEYPTPSGAARDAVRDAKKQWEAALILKELAMVRKKLAVSLMMLTLSKPLCLYFITTKVESISFSSAKLMLKRWKSVESSVANVTSWQTQNTKDVAGGAGFIRNRKLYEGTSGNETLQGVVEANGRGDGCAGAANDCYPLEAERPHGVAALHRELWGGDG
eukprot:1634102-Pleurochrysis_carterae.AAC.1